MSFGSQRCKTRWLGLVTAILGVTSPAGAQECPTVRPTDPAGGLLHYPPEAEVRFYDASDRVRVWFAADGPHAPAPSALGSNGAPENVVLVGEVVESARVSFLDLGFEPALDDGQYAPCASNGGDGRIDVYLIDFPSGADGAAGLDSCTDETPARCSGFVLLENDFDAGGYGDFEEGVRVVAPHELFHLVQNAYDADIGRWWAEGTAQWATEQLLPELEDLERFLPAYFSRTEQALDSTAGGITAGRLYATAIWPVFLSERHGQDVIREIFEASATGLTPATAAMASVLEGLGSSLPSSFLEFAAYNAATGLRSVEGEGYLHADTYPMVSPLPLEGGFGTLHEGVLSGLSAQYFLSSGSQLLTLDAEQDHAAAMAIPVVDGTARLSGAHQLPTRIEGEAIVVVAGQRTTKVDSPFVLRSEQLLADPPVAPDNLSTSGCATHPQRRQTSNAFWAVPFFVLAAAYRRRLDTRKELSIS